MKKINDGWIKDRIKRSQPTLNTGHILGAALWAKRQPNGGPKNVSGR